MKNWDSFSLFLIFFLQFTLFPHLSLFQNILFNRFLYCLPTICLWSKERQVVQGEQVHANRGQPQERARPHHLLITTLHGIINSSTINTSAHCLQEIWVWFACQVQTRLLWLPLLPRGVDIWSTPELRGPCPRRPKRVSFLCIWTRLATLSLMACQSPVVVGNIRCWLV